MMFRREVFERTGLMDENMRFSEDVDLLVRIEETGIRRCRIETVCLYYRRHAGGITGPMKTGPRGQAHLKSWARILKRSLDRRRA
jgi:GT2 family glycosyltransferase